MLSIFDRLFALIRSMFADEEGASLVEYALIVSLVSIAAVAALTTLGGKANNTLTNVSSSLK